MNTRRAKLVQIARVLIDCTSYRRLCMQAGSLALRRPNEQAAGAQRHDHAIVVMVMVACRGTRREAPFGDADALVVNLDDTFNRGMVGDEHVQAYCIELLTHEYRCELRDHPGLVVAMYVAMYKDGQILVFRGVPCMSVRN